VARKKKTTRKQTATRRKAHPVFDFSAGETRTETVDGHEITFRVPDGAAVTGLRMLAAGPGASEEAAVRGMIRLVADHLTAWPWDHEINETTVAALLKGSQDLFFAVETAIETAGEQVKN